MRASPLRWPPTNSSLLSLSPLLVPKLISPLGLQLSWCLPHAGHCSGTVEGGGGPDGTPSHLARGEVQEGGDFQCSGILALRDRTEGAWTVRMGKGTLRQAKLGRGKMGGKLSSGEEEWVPTDCMEGGSREERGRLLPFPSSCVFLGERCSQ